MASSHIELFVETLYGTAFELHVSPAETVISIKSKISRLEGIPVSQQHLIWQSKELEDESSLQDHSITSGCTLKLVLGMRGGPINTRKVSLEERPSLFDVARYLEAKGEELAQSISSLNPLTVVVVRNGDQVHLYTLINNTGRSSISPLSDSLSDVSVKEASEEDGFEGSRFKENQLTRQKIDFLQKRLKSAKRRKAKKSSSTASAKNTNSHNDPFSVNYLNDSFYLPPLPQTASLISNSSIPHSNSRHHLSTYYEDGDPHFSRETTTPPILVQLAQRGIQSLGANLDCHGKSLPRKNIIDGPADVLEQDKDLHLLLQVGRDGSRLPSRGNMSKIVTVRSPPVTLPWWQNVTERQPQDSKRFYKVLPPLSRQAPFAAAASREPSRHRGPDSKNVPSLQCLVELDPWDYKRPKTTPARYVHLSVRTPGEFVSRWPSKHSFSEERISGSTNNISLSVFQKSKVPNQHDRDSLWQGVIPSISLEKIASFQHSGQGKISFVAADISGPQKGIALNKSKKDWFSKAHGNIEEASLRPKTKEDSPSSKLPPVKTKKKLNKRCTWCGRKTGLASTYICRCGKSFCASHRYAEVHDCSHDYKTEGRRLLQKNNPVVKASKLPEI